MDLLKTVFHVHTDYSDDCSNSVEQLVDDARRTGAQCIAVTDHDTIDGAYHLGEIAGPELKVIVGEEISTDSGHLIGLFLRDHIQPGMSPHDTARAIKNQGGLVVVPHPFNSAFGCGLRNSVFDLLDLIDVVEVCNAQNLLPFHNYQAEVFASRFNFTTIVGADIHHGRNLDACYQWLQPFDGPASFVAALQNATFAKGRHTLAYFASTAWFIFWTKFGFSAPPEFGANSTTQRSKLQPRSVAVRND